MRMIARRRGSFPRLVPGTFLFLPAFALVACGGDDPEVTGIYEVKSHTENATGCAMEGAAAEQTTPYFYVKKGNLFGYSFYTAIGCESLELCRASAMGTELFATFEFTFDQVKGGTSLAGSTRFTGFSSANGTCKEPSVADRTFVRTGNDVRIEERTRVGDDYPADKDGFCTTELAEKAARGKPCSKLVVVTASFVEPLP